MLKENTLNNALKKRIIGCIELLPYGHDLYLHLARKRLGITYRGIFSTFECAETQSEATLSSKYDVLNERKKKNLEQELPHLDKQLKDIDYPLIFWLSRIMKPSNNILELGGSIGHGFYSFEHYFPYPQNIQWTIAELDAAVEIGNQLAGINNEARLSFISSKEISTASEADVFLTAGTLQYMNHSIQEILDQLAALPQHVLIHNLPVHPTMDFWTLQYLDICEVPYHIHSMTKLIAAVESLGYVLRDQWKNKRLIDIPYQPNHRVENYFGFYFERRH